MPQSPLGTDAIKTLSLHDRWTVCAQLREKSVRLRKESAQLREALHRFMKTCEALREAKEKRLKQFHENI